MDMNGFYGQKKGLCVAQAIEQLAAGLPPGLADAQARVRTRGKWQRALR